MKTTDNSSTQHPDEKTTRPAPTPEKQQQRRKRIAIGVFILVFSLIIY